MSQRAQPVPPPPPAGVIVCAPTAPQQQPPQGAGQLCGADACGASPPAGPSPPSLPSPPQLCASLNSQDSPLDLSATTTAHAAAAAAAAAVANHRSQEPVQKMKVEQPKQEGHHPLQQDSNILRAQLNTQREVKPLPAPDHEKMECDDSDPDTKGPEQKQCKPHGTPQHPLHTPQRVPATEEHRAGCQYQRPAQPINGSQHREKMHSHFYPQSTPLCTTPNHHTFSPMTYTPLEPINSSHHVREGYMTPIHVQIPGYHHGPVHKKMAASYHGECSPLHNPQQGSAFTRHLCTAGLRPGKERDSDGRRGNCQAAWPLVGDGELRKPEVMTINMLMQPPSSSAAPPLVPPLLGRYSPNHPYGLTPHTAQVAPLPHWASTNWMANAPLPLQQATPPELSSAEASVNAAANTMPPALQSQGKKARPFKIFNYEEHLGEPATHESKVGRLPLDTRENYERFLREKRAQLPSPSTELKARKNAQSPEGEQPSSTEDNADVAAYKARRQKNNLAAKRSRAARHMKEDDIAITSMYFCELIKEYRHSLGVQKLITQQLERQLAATYFRQ